MANIDNVDFRQTSSINDTIESRPLSVYDNLNAGNITATINASTPIKPDQQLPATNINNNPFPDVGSSKYDSDNEYPFSDISFKFDDLPIKSVTRSNSLNNNSINSNNKYNHNIHNNNNNNNNDGGSGSKASSNSAYNFHLNKSNSISNAYDDGIGPLTPIEGRPTTAIAATTTSATPTAINKPYENILDTTTGAGSSSHHHNHNDNDDNSYRPVMSDAKSTFFGLNKSHDGGGSSSTNSNNNQTSTANESEPLISGGARAILTRGAEYQNVPSNSACFVTGMSYMGDGNGGGDGSGSDDGATTAMTITDNDTNQSDSDNIIRSNNYALNGDNKNGERFLENGTIVDNHIGTNSSGSSSSGHRKQFSSAENGNDKKNHNLSQVNENMSKFGACV